MRLVWSKLGLGYLRSKLIASYVVLVFLTLLLAGSGFVYLLRGYQQRLALNRLENLVVPVALQVQVLTRGGYTPQDIAGVLDDQARQLNVRILLIDHTGTVVSDTGQTLVGTAMGLPDSNNTPDEPGQVLWTVHGVGHERLEIVSTPGGIPRSLQGGWMSRSVPSYYVALAVPDQSIGQSWLELLPGLGLAALVSTIISIGVGLILSRSISKPIQDVTRASAAVAEGQYDQLIAVRGSGETAQLAKTFNIMASEVKQSHTTLKDFVANVSHELRTPLTSIQGFSDAIAEGAVKDPRDVAEAGRIINDEARRMSQLVEELLYLSKLEARVKLDMESIDLKSILIDCLERASQRADERHVDLDANLAEAGHVMGDGRMLGRLFDNLLNNGLQHTPDGGKIQLMVQNGSAPEPTPGMLRISVRNSGSAIPEEDLTRVFERFYQVDKSRARKGEGFGLGLAIAREIAESHGGKIWVESDPAWGTQFSVELPSSKEREMEK